MRIIYIGPTIKGLVKKNQIFTYEPKKIMERALQVSTYAGYLFVDMEHIVASKEELAKQGSLLNISYKNVQREVKNV